MRNTSTNKGVMMAAEAARTSTVQQIGPFRIDGKPTISDKVCAGVIVGGALLFAFVGAFGAVRERKGRRLGAAVLVIAVFVVTTVAAIAIIGGTCSILWLLFSAAKVLLL